MYIVLLVYLICLRDFLILVHGELPHFTYEHMTFFKYPAAQ